MGHGDGMTGTKEERELLDLESAGKDGGGLKDGGLRKQAMASLFYCGFYVLVSSMMVFSNKALSHTFKFKAMTVLLLLQMVFTAVLLPVARAMGLISFEKFEWDRALKVAPVSIFYSLNAACALMALGEMSVPSYTLVKRLAPLFTISTEYFVLSKSANKGVIASIFTMAIGTIIAFNDDTSSSLLGWSLGFLSCLFQALYLTFVKKSGVQNGLNTWGVLFYHSILSIPLCVIAVTILNEWKTAMEFKLWSQPTFLIVFIGSLSAGFILNYALFLCTEKTSPTSTVVSGHVKAMAQTVIGMFTFGGVDTRLFYMLGTAVNITGGFGYVYSKYKLMCKQVVKN